VPPPNNSKPPDLDCWSPALPVALALTAERSGSLTSAVAAAIARPPAVLLLDRDRPKAAEPEPPIDVILPLIALRPAGHCPHARCCQCGAVRGTPEHAKECPDAAAMRALAKRSAGYTPRKLSRKP
jgi:hypothetical protein